ncbi:MAG: AI-2E family transporter [Ramlibacter sp.]
MNPEKTPDAEEHKSADATPEDVSRVLLHMPVDVRSLALVVLSVIGVVVMMRWAKEFFIPLMLGMMLSYALSPVVDALQRFKIPRFVSAGVLILGILGGMGAGVYAFSDDANQWIDSLPTAAKKIRDSMHARTTSAETPLSTVQKAAVQIEQAAEEVSAASATSAAAAGRGVQRVVIEKPRFNIRDHLWSGTMGLVNLVGQVVIVTFLTYFMLVSGDTFRRKLVKITGPSLSKRKITVEALNEITEQIQRYLLVQLMTSVVVGIATGLAFWALGLEHAAVWAFAAGVLNLIPYIGSIVVAGAAALVGFVQFGEIGLALAVAGASLAIHTIMGNLIAPWLTSKTSTMNPVAVFVSVLAWGWLWGVWGLLLGVPIMMVVKAICDRVDHLRPVGELLGN